MYTSPKAISRVILLVVGVMVGVYALLLDKMATYTSAYHHLPNSSVSKCCMWIEALGIGTLPVHLTPVEERTILLVACLNQLPRHLSELTALVLGNPLFFHASRGLMEVELTSDHC